MRLLLFVLRMLVLNPLYHFNPAAQQKKPRNFRMKMRDFSRACLDTPRAANFAEFSFHARNFCEGVPEVRQAKVTQQGR